MYHGNMLTLDMLDTIPEPDDDSPAMQQSRLEEEAEVEWLEDNGFNEDALRTRVEHRWFRAHGCDPKFITFIDD